MRVLIYIPKRADKVGMSHEFVATLSRNLGSMSNVDVKYKLPSNIKEYSLIHIISAWGLRVARAQSKASKHDIPTIVSPLGGLQPWIIRKKRLRKALMEFLFQRQMIRNASAIHVTSHIEQQSFERLKWNKRTQLIKNSVITNELSDTDMATQMASLYQKVLDSNCYPMINENTEQAISHLILAGIDPAIITNDMFTKEIKPCLLALSTDDWRHIYIYTHNENITDTVRTGVNNLNINPPKISVADINMFPVERQARRKQPTGKTSSPQEEICGMLQDIRYEAKRHNVETLRLLSLYKKIKFNDYDEDLLSDTLKQAGIYRFASRVMFTLKEFVGLTEGFMPIKMTDDNKAQKLMRIITKLN